MKGLCYLELPSADSFRSTQNATNWNQCCKNFGDCTITSLSYPPKGVGTLSCLFTRPVFGFMERLRGISELLVDITSLKRLGGSAWAQSNLWGYRWMNIWWKLNVTYCNKNAKCKVASSQEMDGDKEWITFLQSVRSVRSPTFSALCLTRLYIAQHYLPPFLRLSPSPFK